MNSYLRGAAAGVLGGLGGAAAMAATAKLEQLATKRPDSYVPAKTLAHVLGLEDPDADRWSRNMAMHYGTGALVGALRGVMAAANLRGPHAALTFTHVRLSVDQVLENATGVGAPPWTWPRDEWALDFVHKAVYALATGAIADALAPPAPGSSHSRPAQDKRLKGFS